MKTQSNDKNGSTLVVIIITMAVVAVFVGLALDYTNNIARNVQRSQLLRQATNIGDAATEMAFAGWRATCNDNPSIAAPNGTYFDSSAELPSPTPGDFPGVSQYSLTNFKVLAADALWNPIAAPSTAPPKVMGPNPQSYSYFYLAYANVVVPTATSKNPTDPNDRGNVVANVRRVLEKRRTNKTNKAIDYKDDLEIHPGPTFVVNGDVHTNGDLYTGHNTLTLNGSTTFSGTWAVNFAPGDSTHSAETPASPSWGAGLPPSLDQAEVPYGVDSSDYHKLIEQNIPVADPLYANSFSNPSNSMAQIIISDSPSPNTVKILNGSGTDITAKANDGKNGANDQLATLLMNALTTNGTIVDQREGATTGNGSVRVASFDVGAINTAIQSGAVSKVDFTSNPVIYITDISADPTGATNKRGIRLKNGAILPSNGLTIASGNPVYIQGDYNSGLNGANQPPSNTTVTPFSSPAPNPTATGYTRVPAAVVADAVTVLSNAWALPANTASYDAGDQSNRVASSTTVNTAIIAGIVPSANGYYSGGAENFPRFLENWNTKNFTYYGSMIELYTSKQAIGKWGASNVYSPPVRAWFFDKNFLSNPPPGVPYDVDYRRSRWYME